RRPRRMGSGEVTRAQPPRHPYRSPSHTYRSALGRSRPLHTGASPPYAHCPAWPEARVPSRHPTQRGETTVTDELSTARHEAYVHVYENADFKELRKRYSTFVVPMTIAFIVWYLLYVICSNWAPDLMSTKVAGNINIALVFGLLQFATT